MHFFKEVLGVGSTGCCEVGRIVGGNNGIEILLCMNLPPWRGGGAGTYRGGTRTLHTSIAIGFVIVADIQEIGLPLECTGESLDPDVNRSTIAGIDYHVGLLTGFLKRLAHSGCTGSSCGKRDIIHGNIHCSIGIDTLDNTGAAGRDHQHGISSCCLEYIPENKGRRAPCTSRCALQYKLFFGDLGHGKS